MMRACNAALYEWRDMTARKRDESLGYVLPRALLLQLARELPTSPQDMAAVLAGCVAISVRSRKKPCFAVLAVSSFIWAQVKKCMLPDSSG